MKRTRRVLSGLAALALAACMAVPAAGGLTAGAASITINESQDGYTYAAYQIFTGTVLTNEAGFHLGNIQWADDLLEDGTLKSGVQTALKGAGEPDGLDFLKDVDVTNAESVAEALSTATPEQVQEFIQAIKPFLGEPDATAEAPADDKYTISNLDPGYYLVENTKVPDQNGVYTSYILEVAGDVSGAPKSDKPTVDKQVSDTDEDQTAPDVPSNQSPGEGWYETADHAINEVFQFKLKAALPERADGLEVYPLDEYETYTLNFVDTLSPGVLYLGEVSITVTSKNGATLTITGDEFATYGVTVDDAQVGDGSAGGTLQIRIADLKALFDALKSSDGSSSPETTLEGMKVEVVYNAKLTEAAYSNLESGKTTNENSVKLEYSNNPNSSGEGQFDSNHGETPEDSVWVFTYGVDNNKIDATADPHVPLEGAGFRLYNQDGTVEIPLYYDAATNAYYPVGDTDKEAVEMQSALNADGKAVFNIRGLDEGTYTLKETTTPSGYNTCDPITITITAASRSETAPGDEELNNVDLTGSEHMNNEIENKEGTVLPGTGGIGTTIFYVVGGMLVVGAGVLLIARKRTQKEEQ